ncbi:MAG: multifunctional CCA tRNA nucleotidyl transferase/2'3'-cyclic phosphodiesterase/2'nucleotidase/phosphatase [Gammaproteobacteria bacterium 28-57-27]|nr:MAG: multifunctional CCA tRNA nucleotidyl transferase/2'3'-cyclic phosphodiesterase/2'nucleotidase/phosphatase [Gammaproteobacteria bacterium 28-57-27]
MKTYLVGGAVRDALLGLPVHERDFVVVGSCVDEMLARGFQQVGKDFPVFLHPQTREEYALARTERKSAPGYHGFVMHASPEVSLEADLARRDLTINAMAQTEDGCLLDPYGGQADLAARVLRHVSPAFMEDPVRILRTARFAARFAGLGFRVADETLDLMRTMVMNAEVDALVPERVWQEMVKALSTQHPARFFEVLREVGALKCLLPELDALFGVPQPEKYHPEIDSGVHSLMVLQQAVHLGADVPTRWAALLHDLGKGATPPEEWPHHYGHEERGARLIEPLAERLRLPQEFRDLAVMSARWHGHVHKVMELRPATLLKLLEAVDAVRRPQRFEQFLLVCEADARGRTGFESVDYPQADAMRRAFAAIKAVSVQPLLAQGLSGAALGQALARARLQALSAREFKQPV